ncbi:hypothetical protein NSQ76_20605 [Bacillus sp. FSL M8-0256]|uniref:hypothetical protein n=1 Tax=Bacillus sp. FSL M8-0256 TaxID=2954578 RepID=UPI0030F8EE76
MELITAQENWRDEFGQNAVAKITQLIEEEGIVIQERFQNSLSNSYEYERDIKDGKCIQRKIIVPQFTDDDALIKTFALASGLGHHYVQNNVKGWKAKFLSSKHPLARYIKEKSAWKKTQGILESIGVLPDENEEKPSIEFKKICSQSEFFSYKRCCLSTYKDELFNSMIIPFKKLLNIALYLIKLQILIYTILGLLYVFNQNNVPVPEWMGISTLNPKDIYKLSFHIFTTIVSLHLFIVVSIKVIFLRSGDFSRSENDG